MTKEQRQKICRHLRNQMRYVSTAKQKEIQELINAIKSEEKPARVPCDNCKKETSNQVFCISCSTECYNDD